MKKLILLVKPAAGLCNMDCGYCFYRPVSEGRENRIMTRGTADLLIEKIARFSPSEVSVMFQGGEPTLAGLDFYKYFVGKMRERIKAPVFYSIQTNALLIDDAFARFIKENIFLTGVSLDGARKTNDRYRLDSGGESVLPRVLDAVSLLNKHKVDFNILSVVDDKNAADIESTYAYFKKHRFGYLQFIPCIDGGGGISLSAESYETFLKKLFDLWYDDYMSGNYISVRHIDNYIGILAGRAPESCAMCGTCGHYFVVESDGSIYPCDFYCGDSYKVGTLYDDSPFEINEKHRAFIEESLLIHSHCKSCKYYALCRGGCRRDRINNYSENIYCGSYYNFFEYAIERMAAIARSLQRKA